MISVAVRGNTNDLDAFVPYAHRRLRGAVESIADFGAHTMAGLVPRGETGRLASAVEASVQTVTDGHYVGSVGVNHAVAPHASFVDKGTGVDGPFRAPITVLRPSRSGRGQGVMRFQKKGEPVRFRSVVKATPSAKIESHKNFSGKTYDAMLGFAAARTGVLATELALYFVDLNDPTI